MRPRRRKAAPPSDEFLRVVKAAARQDPNTPESEAPDEPESGSEAGEEAGTPPPPTESAAHVREEAERRLADARSAIERERELRIAAEEALETTRESEQIEGDAAELVRRRDEAVDAERRLREERERWEETADRQAERRARELAEAERRITEARHAAPTEGPGEEAIEPAVTTNGHPESGEKRRWAPLRRQRGSAQARLCTVCGRGREAGQGDWVITEQVAVCDSCQSDGWTLPKGGRLPVRRAARPE